MPRLLLVSRGIVVVGLLTCAIPPVEAAAPRLGDPAPPLTIEEILDAAKGEAVGADTLEGKALVVEFWATWCRPCVSALGHWNELVEELSGEPIVFLSVTLEDEPTVRPFLAEQKIAGLVGLDLDGSTFRDFGVKRVPYTALVDRSGVLRAETYPTSLGASSLRDLVAGRPLRLPSARSYEERVELALEGVGSPDALEVAEVRPAADPELRGLETSATEYFAFGWRPAEAIAAAFDFPSTRLEVEAELPEGRFDFLLRTPTDRHRRAELLRDLIADAFSVNVTREVRRCSVRVLARSSGSAGQLSVGTQERAVFGTTPGSIRGRGLDLSTLAEALEPILGEPVIDETGLDGRFDIALDWDPTSPGDLERALGALGLELVAARREIELLVVSPREPIVDGR